jgi:alpha-D-ribose 1-methylphosphonate 5-triphosphate synthase subunit PhnH
MRLDQTTQSLQTQRLRETAFDIVFDAQRVFRTLATAMSHPGEVHRIPTVPFERSPEGLHVSLLSVLLTLCDNTVRSAVVGPETWSRYVEVNTGTTMSEPADADYVVVSGVSYEAVIPTLATGTLEYPEDGATVILLVDALAPSRAEAAEGNGSHEWLALQLSGPGVDGQIELAISGAEERYFDDLREANQVYPLGIDMILLDHDGQTSAIPRSSRLEVL